MLQSNHTIGGAGGEHVDSAGLRIAVLTFNLNNQFAPRDPLELAKFFTDTELQHSDMAVIGLQEVSHVELVSDYVGVQRWDLQFKRYLAIKGFINLSLSMVMPSSQLWLGSNVMLIFVKPCVLPRIKRVESRFIRNLLWGLSGHKGAITAKITLKDDVYLLFISSHLSAKEENYKLRVKEFELIEAGLEFAESIDRNNGFIFTFGDLNFRAADVSASEMDSKLATCSPGEISTLVDQHDQLRMAQTKGEAFIEYDETDIKFKPTYRLLVGTTEYDLQRVPSWCDRILHCTKDDTVDGPSLSCKCNNYTSVADVTVSDHFPVKALYELKFAPILAATGWDIKFNYPSTVLESDTAVRVEFPLSNLPYWKEHGSNFDWVAIFREKFTDTREPICWKYLLVCWDEGATGVTCCVFRSLPAGRYRFAYCSRFYDCLIGLSDSFEVIPVAIEAR